MTKIKHHLTEELLIGYAAGTLPEAFSLVVATHLSMCDACRAAANAHEEVGGALLDRDTHVAMSDGALQATLQLIQNTPRDPKDAIKAKIVHPSGVFPTPLQDYVGGDLDAVKWRPIGLGVRQAVLPTGKGATVRLLHIPAGSAVPDHGHNGTELTLVLQGAFRDEEDRFGPGDVEVADEDLNHTPVAEIGEDCICLAATDAPLKFNSIIPRLAQPFLRI
ncbi:MAG: ChrR family anti-sigma-E factor [Pseudomonadota bacterium]